MSIANIYFSPWNGYCKIFLTLSTFLLFLWHVGPPWPTSQGLLPRGHFFTWSVDVTWVSGNTKPSQEEGKWRAKHQKEMLWLLVLGSDAQEPVKQRQKHTKSYSGMADSTKYESQGIIVPKWHESQKHDSYTHRHYILVVKAGPDRITDNDIRKEVIKCTVGRKGL